MNSGSRLGLANRGGLLQIEDCLDAAGNVDLPPGTTLISLIERNIANVGASVAYRYLDYTRSPDGLAVELTWTRLGTANARHRRRGATRFIPRRPGGDSRSPGPRLRRRILRRGQGGDHRGAVVRAGVAGPCRASRNALHDSRPTVVLTTSAAVAAVEASLKEIGTRREAARHHHRRCSRFGGGRVGTRWTSTSTTSPICSTPRDPRDRRSAWRSPIERSAPTWSQMILSIDLLDRNTHGVSWLPLYHDMGLSMIGFPGGVRRTLDADVTDGIHSAAAALDPRAVGRSHGHGRVVTAAPNFAYEYTAQRGLPAAGDDVDLSNVVLIVGSEPVSLRRRSRPSTRPSRPTGCRRRRSSRHTASPRRPCSSRPSHRPPARQSPISIASGLEKGEAVRVAADTPDAVAHVSCGQIARSQWAVIVDPDTGAELPDGRVGEIWLCGNNIGRGYWGRPEETRQTFGAVLRSQLPRAATLTAHRAARRGYGRAIWGSTSTASCTSPGASRIRS